MSKEQVRKQLEELLKKYNFEGTLKEKIFPNYGIDYYKLINSNLLEKCIDINEHINIKVSATPQEIEEGKATVTFTALDDLGVRFIKDIMENENECR